jgi:HTH-type transcriptional regulator/antitoxin HigA
MTTTIATAVPPGDILKEELAARSWTQVAFAEILGVSPRLVSEIISAKRAITPATAKALGAAFGTSGHVWLNLESAYQLSKTDRDDTVVSRRARLYRLAPLKEMIRRHWLEPSEDIEILERRVLDFFEVQSLDQEPQFQPYAARASAAYNSVQRAWMFRARKLARTLPVNTKFSDAKWAEAIAKLKTLLQAPPEVRHAPRILSDAGIRFVILEPLSQTKIDGVCFWLDERSPVVVISLRYDRLDWFWHTLMHEMMHVKSRHGLKEQPRLDVDMLEQVDEIEKAVNVSAADSLIGRAELENFIARVAPLFSKDKIRGFAARLKVHPGIVVGQLQHRDKILWSHSREMLVPVKPYVAGSALTDGWGHVIAVRI